VTNTVHHWTFQFRGNPSLEDKVDDFVAETTHQLDDFDVFTFKFCFFDYIPLNSSSGTSQAAFDYIQAGYDDPTNGVEVRYSQKRFIWWTQPMTRNESHAFGDGINTRIRAYAHQNNKVLLDIADFETRDVSGNRTIDPSTGFEMAAQENCGEQGDGTACHPNGECGERIAKGLHVLMACLAGWNHAVCNQ
jgi:hypothetical protein